MNHDLDVFDHLRVALVGDLMLDCYITGDVSRISPEAPVPVLHVRSERVVAGGSANVATNLVALGVSVSVVGVVGEDETRWQLIRALSESGLCDCAGVIALSDRPTTRKLRIIGARQQIVRVDQEEIRPLDPDAEQRCLAAARFAIDGADIVILSDYGKGVCSNAVLRGVIDHAAAAGKPVIVDPKRRDLAAYRGATILTPNRKELAEATGLPCESDAEAALAAAVARSACDAAILLTRSEKGMSFFARDGDPPLHVPTVAQEVFDVSGAGDTVVAVLAAATAAGVPIVDAIHMANHAAGIVVSKLGTASVARDELRAALASDRASATVDDGRLLTRDEAVALRWAWAREKLTVGIANGCFDLLHPGHVALIAQAAGHCDRLIMALNTDASVRRLKGPSRPVQDEISRATVIGAIKNVSAVVLFDEDTPLELIEALQPDILVKGADYTEDRVVGAAIVKARGGRVVLADLSPGHSTSRLVEAAAVPA